MENQLLRREEWDLAGAYLPSSQLDFQTPQDIARSLLDRPGRFRSPLTWREKLKLKLFSTTDILDHFQLQNAFSYLKPTTAVPYPWQVLLRYLEQQGVIGRGEVKHRLLGHDQPRLHSLLLPLAPRLGGASHGSGNHPDFNTALSKAVGETIERYCISEGQVSCCDTPESLKQKKKKFLHPSEISQLTDEQKQLNPKFLCEESDTFGWVNGQNILTGDKVLLPASSVYIFRYQKTAEKLIREMNSNGAAGGFTREEAILSGIYELIERDGFLIYWLNAIPPNRIDLESSECPTLIKLFHQLKKYHFEYHLLNTTTDLGIPTITCVIVDRTGTAGSCVSVGSSTGFDISSTIASSVTEAVSGHNSRSLSQGTFRFSQQGYKPFSDKKIGRDERIKLWWMPEMYRYIEKWISGPKIPLHKHFPSEKKFSSIQSEYAYVLNLLKSKGSGYDVFVFDKEHTILHTLGYYVVKVIIPRLVHMYLNESRASIGAERLRSVPPQLGYKSPPQWFPWPHPFP